MAWNVDAGTPFVTVSARGMANGLASVPNDGANFGPDTSGTTTSGIQEALNAISQNGGTISIQRGTYTLNNPIYQTGNYQTVIFEAGTTLLIGSSFPTSGLPSWPGVIKVGWNLGNTGAFHHCYWFGNGTVLNLSGVPSNVYGIAIVGVGPIAGGPSPAPYMIRVDGFEISGSAGSGGNDQVFVACGNGNGSHPAYNQSLNQVHLSRIYTHNPQSGFTGSGITARGSTRGVIVEDCYIDASTIGPTVDNSALFFACPQGDNFGIVVRRTFVISNSKSGSVLELQGSEDAVGGTVTKGVLLEDSVFAAPDATGAIGGKGRMYIDDDNGHGAGGNGPAFILNVEFRRCQFLGAQSGGNQTYIGANSEYTDSTFGYIRFRLGGIAPNSAAGAYAPNPIPAALGGRGPGETPTPITGLSGTSYTRTNTDGLDEDIIVSGGTVSSITLNTVVTGRTSGVFRLRDGDSLTVNYSSGHAPSMWRISA